MKNSSLNRVLLGWADSAVYWWPWRRFRPEPGTKISAVWLMIRAVTGFVGIGLLGGLSGRLLLGQWDVGIALLLGAVGGVAGWFWAAMVAAVWNQRVATSTEAPGLAGDSESQVVTLPARNGKDRCLTEPLVVVGGLALAVSCVWNVENLRGHWALRQFESELRAKGAPVTVKEVAPPEIPDERNLAAAPMFKSMLDYRREPIPGGRGATQVVWGDPEGFAKREKLWNIESRTPSCEAFRIKRAGAGEGRPMAGPSRIWSEGQALDLGLWQAYYLSLPEWLGSEPGPAQSPAKDVLRALVRIEPELQELRVAAAERPGCRFPLRYEEGFEMLIPSVAHVKKIAMALRLRSVALLAEGRSEEALADLLLGLRTSDALADEPILISALVRIAIDVLMMQPIWEGCREHRWTEPQLVAIQRALAERDYLGQMRRGLEGERVLTGASYDVLARSDFASWLLGRDSSLAWMAGQGDDETGFRWLVAVMPAGWVRQNQVLHGRYLRAIVEDLERARFHKDLPREGLRLDEFILHAPPRMMITRMLAPAVDRAWNRAFVMEANRRMAMVAMALERHRLARGDYPSELAALTPAYLGTLPEDPMTGEPLRYVRLDGGEYRLYSVGLDHGDDGGERGERSGKSRSDSEGPSDLVWW